MVPIGAFVIRYWQRLSLSWRLACVFVLVANVAHANTAVTVVTAGPDLELVTGHLCAELVSAGYTVSVDQSEAPLACRSVDAIAQVSVTVNPADGEAALATVCYQGAQVVVGGSRRAPGRFAISAAEALNGLRAKAPASGPEPRSSEASLLVAPTPSPPPVEPHAAVSVSNAVLLHPGGFPALWGITLDSELRLSPRAALMVGGFFPVSRAELASEKADLHGALTFLRAGPALRRAAGDLEVRGSLAVGIAYTWVSAEAVPPYIGGTDSAFSFIGGAGLHAVYPRRGTIFAAAAGRAQVLLPTPRFVVPLQAAQDFGALIAELSLGVGVRL